LQVFALGLVVEWQQLLDHRADRQRQHRIGRPLRRRQGLVELLRQMGGLQVMVLAA